MEEERRGGKGEGGEGGGEGTYIYLFPKKI